jgi:hypothetical protein
MSASKQRKCPKYVEFYDNKFGQLVRLVGYLKIKQFCIFTADVTVHK